MDKSPEAFRTISEVAEALETPAHVLRFWESRFPQIKPVKRAGGRRYYRPSDVALLTGIKRLLHDEGMTIRGVQKILREQGIRHVAGLTEEATPEEEALEAAMIARFDAEPAPLPEEAEEETAAALEAALEASADPEAPFDTPDEAEDHAGPETAAPVSDAGPQRSTLDWLASLPDAALPDSAEAEEEAEHAGTGGDGEGQQSAPYTPPTETSPDKLALVVRAVTGGQLRAGAGGEAADIDDTIATLASRLRALPRGSLAARREAVAQIAERIDRLRDRLASRPPGP